MKINVINIEKLIINFLIFIILVVIAIIMIF